MTDKARLVKGLELIAEGVTQIALAIESPEVGERVAPSAVHQPATIRPPAESDKGTTWTPAEKELVAEIERVTGAPVVPEGHLLVCPKHHKPFTEGRYGPYCQSMTDEPAWANKKGFCNITPGNAAKWLEIHA